MELEKYIQMTEPAWALYFFLFFLAKNTFPLMKGSDLNDYMLDNLFNTRNWLLYYTNRLLRN